MMHEWVPVPDADDRPTGYWVCTNENCGFSIFDWWVWEEDLWQNSYDARGRPRECPAPQTNPRMMLALFEKP